MRRSRRLELIADTLSVGQHAGAGGRAATARATARASAQPIHAARARQPGGAARRLRRASRLRRAAGRRRLVGRGPRAGDPRRGSARARSARTGSACSCTRDISSTSRTKRSWSSACCRPKTSSPTRFARLRHPILTDNCDADRILGRLYSLHRTGTQPHAGTTVDRYDPTQRRRAGILVPLFSIPSITQLGHRRDRRYRAAGAVAARRRPAVLQLLPINEMPPGERRHIRRSARWRSIRSSSRCRCWNSIHT